MDVSIIYKVVGYNQPDKLRSVDISVASDEALQRMFKDGYLANYISAIDGENCILNSDITEGS